MPEQLELEKQPSPSADELWPDPAPEPYEQLASAWEREGVRAGEDRWVLGLRRVRELSALLGRAPAPPAPERAPEDPFSDA